MQENEFEVRVYSPTIYSQSKFIIYSKEESYEQKIETTNGVKINVEDLGGTGSQLYSSMAGQ